MAGPSDWGLEPVTESASADVGFDALKTLTD